MGGSLCPHYSKGLLVQGTREAGPVCCSVINLSLSDLTAIAKRKEALPTFSIHKQRGGDRFYECKCRGMTSSGETCNQIISSKNIIQFNIVSV